MNRDNFDKKEISVYYYGRFKTEWKAATTEYAENVYRVNRGKRGCSSKDVADKFNSEFLGSPNYKKINNHTLTESVRQGEVGVSPKKMGRPSTIPYESPLACATHATMMQVSGEAKESGSMMSSCIQALIHGTKWEK